MTSQQIHEFSTNGLVQDGTINAFGTQPGGYAWGTGGGFGIGELKMSPDGTMLFAGIDGGVSIITTPEPGGLCLATITFAGLLAATFFRLRSRAA